MFVNLFIALITKSMEDISVTSIERFVDEPSEVVIYSVNRKYDRKYLQLAISRGNVLVASDGD